MFAIIKRKLQEKTIRTTICFIGCDGLYKKISEEYASDFEEFVRYYEVNTIHLNHDNDILNNLKRSFEENMFRIVMSFANGNFEKEYFKFKKITNYVEGLNEIEKKLQEKYSNVNLQFCKVDVNFNNIIPDGLFYIYVCLIDEGSQLDIFFVNNDKSEDFKLNKCSFKKKPIQDCYYSYIERVEKSNQPIPLKNLVSKGIECEKQFNKYINYVESPLIKLCDRSFDFAKVLEEYFSLRHPRLFVINLALNFSSSDLVFSNSEHKASYLLWYSSWS